MESFGQTGCNSFHREREDYLGRQPGPGLVTGQVVQRYRETAKYAIRPRHAHCLAAAGMYIGRLERQDIFTAVTPANVKLGWLVYNQAHQDGLDPPSSNRLANGQS